MFGAVVIWYAAGALIGGMIANDARMRKRASAQEDGFTALLWLALAAAAIIFALWPWVALNLAHNATL